MLMETSAENTLPLLDRLWIYQNERIPLFKTAALLAVFSSASVNVSALLAGRAFPSAGGYATAFLVALVIFVQLRACDEYKDGPDDRRYRPERPIPRGLVSLRLVLGIGVGLAPVAALAAWVYYPPLLLLLALVWTWLALMTAEFFLPQWLKARPILYLVSHMAIMPLLDLFVTGVEWLPAGASPAKGLVLFLILSFVNGCVLEIGRKTWAPENEREGVETYSELWGVRRATSVWIAMTGLSFLLLLGVGLSTGHLLATGLPGLFMLLVAWWIAFDFRKVPDGKHQNTLDTASGLWVFVSYTATGFAPLAGGLLS